jgi:hypothetical protein
VVVVNPSLALASGPTLVMPRPIAGIAADGPRVAVITGSTILSNNLCPLVWLKNLVTAHTDRLAPASGFSCYQVQGSGPVSIGNGGAGVYHGADDPVGRSPLIALSGKRAAWLVSDSGNFVYDNVATQAIGERRDRAVGGVDQTSWRSGFGDWRSGIVGDSSELVYQRFTVGVADPTCDPAVSVTPCVPAVYAPATVRGIPRDQVLASSLDSVFAQRIAHGLVAGIRMDGTATLVRLSDATTLATIGTPAAPAVSAAVGGAWFAAATADGHLLVDSADGL